MEKKGDLLNQLAIISDLTEKLNLESVSSIIIIQLMENEFYRIFDLIEKKYSRKTEKPKDSFTLKIGSVEILFNKSNV